MSSLVQYVRKRKMINYSSIRRNCLPKQSHIIFKEIKVFNSCVSSAPLIMCFSIRYSAPLLYKWALGQGRVKIATYIPATIRPKRIIQWNNCFLSTWHSKHVNPNDLVELVSFLAWLILCVNLAGPKCPDIWSNIILDVSMRVVLDIIYI